MLAGRAGSFHLGQEIGLLAYFPVDYPGSPVRGRAGLAAVAKAIEENGRAKGWQRLL